MTGAPSSTDLLARKLEAKLARELVHARAEVERLEIELAEVQQALIESGQPISSAGAHFIPKAPTRTAEPEQVGAGGPYVGLTLIDAAVEYLKSHQKLVAVGMICAVLESAGFAFASGHPTRALGEALRKRMIRHGDIFGVGSGLWGYRDNFTPAQITRLTKKHAGMGGRSPEEHGTKTKGGIERRRANGKRIGAERKFTAEKAAELLRLLDEGWSVRRVCNRLKISTATYYNHRKLLKAWKVGEPWPPKEVCNTAEDEVRPNEGGATEVASSDVDQPTRLRVIK